MSETMEAERPPLTITEAAWDAFVSGGYDYLLKIVAPSVAHFQALMERLLQDDIGIKKFTSRIVLRQSAGKRAYPLSLITGQVDRV